MVGEETRFDRSVRHIIWILMAVLLASLCVLTWRLTILVARLDNVTTAVSGDLKQITSGWAEVMLSLHDIKAGFDWVGQEAQDALRVDEAQNIVNEMASLSKEEDKGGKGPDARAEAEINYLLALIGDAELKIEYSGKEHSTLRMRLQLTEKYKAYKHTLVSAEDFISRVATKTIAGNTYYVIKKDGTKTELASWLTELLKQYRVGGKQE